MKYSHLWYQINIIRFFIKHTFIVYLFGAINIYNHFYNFEMERVSLNIHDTHYYNYNNISRRISGNILYPYLIMSFRVTFTFLRVELIWSCRIDLNLFLFLHRDMVVIKVDATPSKAQERNWSQNYIHAHALCMWDYCGTNAP